MPKINVLPKQVAELIAAGEVVEKPASVIKEITENAIDAGATVITVEIKNGGILYMRVTDNGCGIPAEDVKTAFLRHATSKIVKEEDLDGINTLGFRGEALAAICAVSKMEMITRTELDDVGTRYIIEGGTEKLFEETGCPTGTTVIIRDLFYNTPARMKFLRKDVYEANVIADVVEKMALSHPEVAFHFIRDGKKVLTTPGDGKLSSAIYSVLGREFSSGLIEVNDSLSGIKINGFVCKPVYCRPKRNAQYFFLNNRTIRSATATAALEAAYKNAAMVGKFPACVLNIDVPVETVDVNVHPAKTEVRFSNEKPVFDAVYFAVKNALQRGDSRPQISVNKQPKFSVFERMTAEEYRQTAISEPKKETTSINKEYTPIIKTQNQSRQPMVMRDFGYRDEPLSTSAPIKKIDIDITVDDTPVIPNVPPVAETETPKHLVQPEQIKADELKTEDMVTDLRYVGEVFKTYIIVEKGETVYFIDKHAAHERILFEELKKTQIPQSQALLIPVTVKLSAKEYAAVTSDIKTLEKAGFEVEDFGNSCVLVRGVPATLTKEDVQSIMLEVAANLAQNGTASTASLEDIYHTVACKAAIKAGFKTTPEEQLYLAKQVLGRNDIMYCPHGRPVAFEMKRKEMEKQFGRIQT